MKTWKILAPLGLLAAGAAAAAVVLKKKPAAKTEGKAAAPVKGKAPEKKKAPVGRMETGSYEFISGFKDAKTVELKLRYDADRYDFSVIGEDFLAYSSDSHVAVLRGEEFSLQIEYAGYYHGEDFAALAKEAEAKYQSFARAGYGANEGFCYIAGDNVCFCFPTGDPYSYVLVTLFKAKDNDTELSEMPADPFLSELLDAMAMNVKS